MNTHLSKSLAIILVILGISSSGAYASDRSTYTASAVTRGTSVNIPEERVTALCGDIDGCEVRIAMYNWDGTRRTASRHTLFYYNSSNGVWRASAGDRAGTNNNNLTEHVINAWACYFTDGYYTQWYNHGDINRDFAVLSWNQYDATCRVTLVD